MKKTDQNKIPIFDTQSGKTEFVPKVVKSETEWKKELPADKYHVLREKGTE